MLSQRSSFFFTAFVFFCLISAITLFPACGSAQALEITLTTRTSAFTGNIYIGGAANNPGLYPFKQDDSLNDLIKAAGGLKNGADISQVSMTIPAGESAAPQRIDINRAGAWLLAALPGIGETHANDIIAYREQNGPFRAVTDMLKVKGIGQATLDRIKDLITVSG